MRRIDPEEIQRRQNVRDLEEQQRIQAINNVEYNRVFGPDAEQRRQYEIEMDQYYTLIGDDGYHSSDSCMGSTEELIERVNKLIDRGEYPKAMIQLNKCIEQRELTSHLIQKYEIPVKAENVENGHAAQIEILKIFRENIVRRMQEQEARLAQEEERDAQEHANTITSRIQKKTARRKQSRKKSAIARRKTTRRKIERPTTQRTIINNDDRTNNRRNIQNTKRFYKQDLEEGEIGGNTKTKRNKRRTIKTKRK